MTVLIYTDTGTIAFNLNGATSTSGGTLGIDGFGYFGSPGGSIVGMPYSVTWTASSDCECIGAAGYQWLQSIYPLPNPILDVTLTINGLIYDFGGGGYYGEFYLGNNPSHLVQQQTAYSNGGSFISTSIGFAPGSLGGEFQIINPTIYAELGGIFADQITSGVFEHSPVSVPAMPVPAPTLGTGISSLVVILALLSARLIRRRLLMSHAHPDNAHAFL